MQIPVLPCPLHAPKLYSAYARPCQNNKDLEKTHMKKLIAIATVCGLLAACAPPASHDLILRGGDIYDGSGGDPFVGDVAIDGDTIIALGDIGDATATIEIDVKGLAVAPGFVNMMSWANESLIEDGHSQSDIRQGVTLEIMGEGNSMGPLNESMKAEMAERQSDIRYDIEWTTLAEYLEFLERGGISPNVASFIGSATPRRLRRDALSRNGWPIALHVAASVALHPRRIGALIDGLRGPTGSSVDDDDAELTYIGVSPRTRRGRVGTQLVDAFNDAMRDAGVGAYQLSVDGTNEPAVRFYRARGFRQVGKYHQFDALHIRYKLALDTSSSPMVP